MTTDAEATLSAAEADTLIASVQGGAPAAKEAPQSGDAGTLGADGRRIRAFNPNTQQRTVHGRLHTLDIINERFTRDFRLAFFNLVRRNADVTIESVKIQPYREFAEKLPIPSNINLVSLRPLRGSALVVFPPEVVSLVVDCLFGGSGSASAPANGRDFSSIELRMVNHLLELTLAGYRQSWENVHPLELAFERAEMQMRFTNITTSPNEPVINSTFQIEIGSIVTRFHICIPYASIEPIREILGDTAAQKNNPDELLARTQRLARGVSQSSVTLTAGFTTVQSTLAALGALKVGDVLPIDLPEEITVHVDALPVFTASYGQVNGRKALHITRLIDQPTRNPTGGATP